MLLSDVPCGYVPAHNTLKVILPVLNRFKIVSEEYFKFQEFYSNKFDYIKNKSMNMKTIQFAEVNRWSSHWNIFLEIGIPKQEAKSLNSACGEIEFLLILEPGSQQLLL